MIAVLDLLSFFTAFICIFLLFTLDEKRKHYFEERWMIGGLVLSLFLYSLLMAFERFKVSLEYEFLENIIGAMIPMWWLFYLYSLMQLIQNMSLKESENKLRTTLMSIGDAVITTDEYGFVTQMNPQAEMITECSEADALGKKIFDVFNPYLDGEKESFAAVVEEILKEKSKHNFLNGYLINKNADKIIIKDSVAPILDEDKNFGLVVVFRDVTDEIKIQEQLLHSRKMDAIGQIAGGVAHDFNNMLTGILGGSELIKHKNKDKNLDKYIDTIIDSASRSSELTRKLLQFSRKNIRNVVPLSCHESIKNVVALLERTVDRKISIETYFDASHDTIYGDEAEIQNILLNLGINASDAMSDGGKLIYSTKENYVDEKMAGFFPFNISVGNYLKITVSDTGKGIPNQHLEKIFDPFFSTKEKGKGTGLGLSAVYNTIKQHNGTIKVYSEVDKGSVFTILLPLADKDVSLKKIKEDLVYGEGRILIVDDELVVRNNMRDILDALGYEVMSAATPDEAIDIFEKHQNEIDLIILDMIMPKLGGKQCFYRFRKIDPSVKIIVVSGFYKVLDIKELEKNNLNGFIHKPFSMLEISRKIAEVLK